MQLRGLAPRTRRDEDGLTVPVASDDLLRLVDERHPRDAHRLDLAAERDDRVVALPVPEPGPARAERRDQARTALVVRPARGREVRREALHLVGLEPAAFLARPLDHREEHQPHQHDRPADGAPQKRGVAGHVPRPLWRAWRADRSRARAPRAPAGAMLVELPRADRGEALRLREAAVREEVLCGGRHRAPELRRPLRRRDVGIDLEREQRRAQLPRPREQHAEHHRGADEPGVRLLLGRLERLALAVRERLEREVANDLGRRSGLRFRRAPDLRRERLFDAAKPIGREQRVAGVRRVAPVDTGQVALQVVLQAAFVDQGLDAVRHREVVPDEGLEHVRVHHVHPELALEATHAVAHVAHVVLLRELADRALERRDRGGRVRIEAVPHVPVQGLEARDGLERRARAHLLRVAPLLAEQRDEELEQPQVRVRLEE